MKSFNILPFSLSNPYFIPIPQLDEEWASSFLGREFPEYIRDLI